MRVPRLFVNTPLAAQQQIGLLPARAHYLNNVLRLKVGDSLIVFNGEGGQFQATLESLTKKQTFIRLHGFEKVNNESPLFTELTIGVSKGERMDWVMQKATELGVNRLVPLLSERTEIKLNAERWQKKLQHWREIIISACEQCGRNLLPELTAPQTLPAYLTNCTAAEKLILHPQPENFSLSSCKNSGHIALLIGAEGGFSDNEVRAAIEAGFVGWSLGPRILRTETAPVVALSLLQARFGDV